MCRVRVFADGRNRHSHPFKIDLEVARLHCTLPGQRFQLFGSSRRFPVSNWIEEGQPAPDFTLAADDGKKVKLKDQRGSPVVLYFYPRDDTPGCTREACAFRDRKQELVKLGAKVFGVSTDDVASHVKFRDKYELNFPLLADVDHKVAEKYGAWQEKNMYGKKSWGVQRSTFLIDDKGVVRKVWKRVSVDGHDEQVLAELKKIGE
jgi:peroxiredoxin Q/BCP